MSKQFPVHNASNAGTVFAQLNQQDVEAFYIGYQRWNMQHQFEVLRTRLEELRKQMAVNTERMQEVQPTAIELATLARLQSNGVNDVELLDRMLERGELWLDRTMQRLDYLEQLDDFISDDYTQWCQHALEGAYDWIDSVLDGNPPSQPLTATTGEEKLTEATEELFLQKISNDEYKDESVMLETTMKRPAITRIDLEESIPSTELPAGEVKIQEHETDEVETITKAAQPAESSEVTVITSVSSVDQPNLSDNLEPVSVEPSTLLPKTSPAIVSRKRPNFFRRFFGKIWGS